MYQTRLFTGILCYFLILVTTAESSTNSLAKWREAFIDCVRIESLSPNLMIRNLTLFALASHDSLNTANPKYEKFLENNLPNPPKYNIDALIAGCGWTLAQSFPARLSEFSKLSRLPVHRSL